MNQIFPSPPSSKNTPPSKKEKLFLFLEFLTGLFFLIGSLLFFRDQTEAIGITLFVLGSSFLLLSTLLKLRELSRLKIPEKEIFKIKTGSPSNRRKNKEEGGEAHE